MAITSPPRDIFAWQPDAATVERAQVTRFLRHTGKRDFAELSQWSVDDVPGFTEQVLQFLDIRFDHPYSSIVDLSKGIPWPSWCVGGRLNISVSCLGRHPEDRPAVIWEGEEGFTRTLTYGELAAQASACGAGLRALGVGRGDAVAIHLPMLPETIVALLACARAGA